MESLGMATFALAIFIGFVIAFFVGYLVYQHQKGKDKHER